MARLLTQLGIPCGHESLFDFRGFDGLCERLAGKRSIALSDISREDAWVDPATIVADSSYGAAPYLGRDPCETVPVIHVVRHPMWVISSFVRDFRYFASPRPNDRHWQDFIYTHLPELCKIKTSLERACYFYVQWNKMIADAKQDRKYMRHRVEDGLTPKLIKFLGLDGISRIPTVPTNTNSRRKGKTPIALKFVPNGAIKDEFVALAKELGYKML